MPKISVIVPVYKVEPYLRRCVDSVLAQTYTDFELILVDDGSPDNCPTICDEYQEKDSRVVVIHQENGGLSAARNAGIDWAFANSNSEWLFFVDSDDWIHPMSLEALMNGAKQTGLDVVIGGFEETDGEVPHVDESALDARVCDTEQYFMEHNVNATIAWGKFYRKECFKEIRYPFGKIHEDEFTTYKILFQFSKIAVIAQPLYAYYYNSEGIMRSEWSPKRLDAVEALRERLHFFENQGNEKLARYTAKILCLSLYGYLKLISQSPYNSEYYSKIKKIFQKSLVHYRKMFSFTDNIYLYETAYPNLIWLCRILYAPIKKIEKSKR